MKFIGLLMVADEDDILERTLGAHAEFVDCFYALDGSDIPSTIVREHPKCAWYVHDSELGGKPVDGWRQVIHDRAVEDHGTDNWFVLLHGDEVWTTAPQDVAHDRADAYLFPLPFFFPREPWDYNTHALDQLRWSLWPGWPEYRMFRGREGVRYDITQHFNVMPNGLQKAEITDRPILHYPYRSPEVQRWRARRHADTGFDPDNYRHINDDDAVYWTDEMIAGYRSRANFGELVHV